MVTLSIIIPVYNSEKTLRKCLDSIRNQTLKDIEVICINDGSSDNSVRIMNEYAADWQNMQVISQTNQGPGVARNVGIKKADGQYLCFMDADDYYANDTVLYDMYYEAKKQDALICGGVLDLVSPTGRIKKSIGYPNVGWLSFADYGDFYFFQRYLYRTDFIKDNQIWFPQRRVLEDPEFCLLAFAKAGKFWATDLEMYEYRMHETKKSFDERSTYEIVDGIEACLKIARSYDVKKTYSVFFKDALMNHLSIIYPYACVDNGPLWEKIDSINHILRDWMNDTNEAYKDKASLIQYVNRIKEEWKVFLEKCRASSPLVLYGAGEVGQYLQKKLEEQGIKILGYAVTDTSKCNMYDSTYEVRAIRSYEDKKQEIGVVVAVGKKYSEEVIEELQKRGFLNICHMEYQKVAIINSLIESGHVAYD